MKDLLKSYIDNPDDSEANWKLAVWYYDKGLLSAAMSFFLRCAERCYDTDPLLAYESLCHASNCYLIQGSRTTSVRGLLHQAVSIDKTRPEAPYLLSTLLEHTTQWDGHWIEVYQYASMAADASEFSEFRKDIGYRLYKSLFQKAHSAWQIGKTDEASEIFAYLYLNEKMNESHTKTVYNNLKVVGLDFKGNFKTEYNFSEACQDLFVMNLYPDKGFYVELGSGHPFHGNNTVLLERNGWDGVSIDYDEKLIKSHKKYRRHSAVYANAVEFDYDTLPLEITYLQVDLEPPQVSLEALQKFLKVRSAKIITFEHDLYAEGPETQEKAHQILTEENQYVRVVKNVCPADGTTSKPFEDWYVHSSFLSNVTATWTSSTPKDPWRYIELYK